MKKAAFIDTVRQNKVNAVILDRLEDLKAPDTWLVSGALFQTGWNVETARRSTASRITTSSISMRVIFPGRRRTR